MADPKHVKPEPYTPPFFEFFKDIPEPIYVETDGALENPDVNVGINPDDLLSASLDIEEDGIQEKNTKKEDVNKNLTPQELATKLDLQAVDALPSNTEKPQVEESSIEESLPKDSAIKRTKSHKLNKATREKIKEMSQQGVSIKEIAKYLDRSVYVIHKYLKKDLIAHHELSKQEQDYNVLEDKLLHREYYGELVTQFSDRELEYFQNTWIHLMLQFRDNVLFAEELQLKQLITIDILLNRCMQERKRHLQDVDRLQQLLDDEYNKDEDTRDDTMMSSLETQLSYARNSIGSYTTEYTKLLDKQQGINKDLKATRDQRIKRIEDSKTSFSNWVRMLEDETLRKRIGDNAELLKLAKDNAKKKLGELHTYVDGQVDAPLLNEHTAKIMTEDDTRD